MRYRATYRSRRGRGGRSEAGVMSYLMPFLILICIGIIGVLGFNLWKSIYAPENAMSAYMHFVEGDAKLKPFGTDTYVAIDSDTALVLGDEVLTSSDARVIIEFFDGTIVRLDGETNVIFEEIDDQSKVPFLKLMLVDGKIWMNKIHNDSGRTNIDIRTENLVVRSEGASSFAVDNNFDEAVRVMDGDKVFVDVMSEDGKSLVDTVEIAVGQEVVFSDEVLERFLSYTSPNVLEAISEVFRRSEWYEWNAAEDESPTEFKKSGEAVLGEGLVEVEPEVIGDEVVEEDDEETDLLEEDIPEDLTEDLVTDLDDVENFGAPTISSVAGVSKVDAKGFYVVTTSNATLKGGVPSGTESVSVNGYTLTQYKPGSTQWQYFANADYGYMKEGENTYEVYAVDKNGKKSSVLTVKVMYKPAPKVTQPVVTAPTTPVVTQPPVDDEPETPPADEPEVPAENVETPPADPVNGGATGANDI